MNSKNNRRAQNTQQKIKAILLEKLSDKHLHQVTVQEICHAAKINRTTFYMHFDNLADVMQTIEAEMQEGIKQLFLDPESGMYKPLTDQSLERLIAYLHENANFYRVLLNDLNSLELLDRELAASWEREIEPVFRKKGEWTEIELRYRFEYFNSGFRGIIRRWLNERCPESPAELARVIKNVVQV